jgi:hypothetical protein
MAKAKKKPGKKKLGKGTKVSLRSVPMSDYQVKWDSGRNKCVFAHKSGKGGELGCGVTDVLTVFSGNKRIYVLSINYSARYACIEAFADAEGVEDLLFAEPNDVTKIFGADFSSHSPKNVAEHLAGMMRG